MTDIIFQRYNKRAEQYSITLNIGAAQILRESPTTFGMAHEAFEESLPEYKKHLGHKISIHFRGRFKSEEKRYVSAYARLYGRANNKTIEEVVG